MSILRRLLAVGATAVLALTGAGVAQAATQQQIYRDLADNGRLDGKYSRAEIQRIFSASSSATTRPALPRKPIRETREDHVPRATAKPADKRPLPFTALDLALLAAGGGPLLLIGARLRRRIASRRPAEARVVSG